MILIRSWGLSRSLATPPRSRFGIGGVCLRPTGLFGQTVKGGWKRGDGLILPKKEIGSLSKRVFPGAHANALCGGAASGKAGVDAEPQRSAARSTPAAMITSSGSYCSYCSLPRSQIYVHMYVYIYIYIHTYT